MTTGTRTFNNQVWAYTDCGNTAVGDKSTITWSGVDTPDPNNRGENPFQKTWSTQCKPVFEWYWAYANGFRKFGGVGTYEQCGFGGPYGGSWPFTDEDTLYLQNRILSLAKGSDANFLISAAEGKETLGMLKNACISVYRAYRSFRRGNVREAYRALRDGNLANGRKLPRRLPKGAYSHDPDQAWLAIRYGWLPLLSDVYNVCDFLEARARKKESDFRIFKASRLVNSTTQLGSGQMPRSVEKWVHRYAVRAKVNTLWLSSFRDLQATGVMDPELVVWELLPYSFVVDWFIPVGTWLEARSALPRLGATYIITKKSAGSWGDLQSSPLPGYQVAPNLSQVTSGSFSRTVTTSWGVPLPSFRNPLKGSWKHVVDAFALWRSAHK